MKILHVVGARPNFMKIAPIMREMAKYPEQFEQILVHTGQHYDENMSQVFFEELGMPRPDVNLEVGSGSHAQQTALIMQRFEPVLLDYQPDWVFVPGDVNSTIACALVAIKLGIKVAHVESGLRSFDRAMPEEINRVLTDHLADLLFTTEPSGYENLRQEGISPEKIHFVGNTMIDSLVHLLPKAEKYWSGLQERLGLEQYVLVTLHRPSNVDDPETLQEIMAALLEISRQTPVIFPVHPRTRQRIAGLDLDGLQSSNNFQVDAEGSHMQLIEPLGYLDFLALQVHASLVLTDSGGVQEETTYLGIPCLTVRPNTERPITLTQGTNRLVVSRRDALLQAVREVKMSQSTSKSVPKLWDGQAAQRVINRLQHEKV
ncbi:MAG: UDP-N-acetylglucosamine 2-epimerase (non-hydrolyzing) [Anaerolineales bacterium]|nr:UDP-N-acetylglucosamine 2-epimerase (non-hydrolyzing) [Anaerolineales bacterium]